MESMWRKKALHMGNERLTLILQIKSKNDRSKRVLCILTEMEHHKLNLERSS